MWSDILLRAKYDTKRVQGSILYLNEFVRSVLRGMPNACVIRNSHLVNPDEDIYWEDNVHIKGNLSFRQNLSNALGYFNTNPGAFTTFHGQLSPYTYIYIFRVIQIGDSGEYGGFSRKFSVF